MVLPIKNEEFPIHFPYIFPIVKQLLGNMGGMNLVSRENLLALSIVMN
jgi:hypothetical protein